MYLVNDSSTTSKRSIWPEEMRGLWVKDAWQSQLLLSNEKAYDDWASALGANTLGYDWYGEKTRRDYAEYFYTDFEPAASLPWQIEHDFAQEFCEAMGTEAVRFFKSGSDAVSCAVRLARAFTNREAVLTFDKDYHGTGDWFGQALWNLGGITGRELAIATFGQEIDIREGYIYNADYWCSLEAKKVAAIVVEPCPKAIVEPPAGWLQHLREVCDEHGIILISDEVILGYRHHLRGYCEPAGIRADLRCYGKAMGQGSALSACTGSQAIMSLLRNKVHFSGTNNGEPLPLHIARETLSEYIRDDICAKLNQGGLNLRGNLWIAGFETRGLDSRFEVAGCTMDTTRFCFERGILFPGWCSIAVSHTEEQMRRLVDALVAYRDFMCTV